MEPESQETGLRPNSLAIPAAIILAGIIIAGAIYLTNGPRPNTSLATISNPAAQQPPTSSAVDIANVKLDGHPALGNPNAPVTIAYWYDYQCPFCRKTEEEVMPQLVNDYVKPGKVRIVYKDFQFLGPDSQTAGLAEHAIWEIAPEKFYTWHKAMYDKQDNENSGWGSKADILVLAQSLGIDSAKVDQLMATKATEYQKVMDDDKAEGGGFGVTGTPSFIIGKQLIVGAQPYTSIKQVIDLALTGK